MDEPGKIPQICFEMIAKEEAGGQSRPYFEELIDDNLRFQRFTGTPIGKKEFLDGLQAGANRGRTLEPPGIDVTYYENVAVASLCVRIKNDLFRNIRIFVFDAKRQSWLLKMWHNTKAN